MIEVDVQFAPRIERVVADDMCIACGACVEACPPSSIVPSFNKIRGAHEVAVIDHAACVSCTAPCDAVCPSIEVNLLELLGTSGPVDRQGPIASVWLGFASDHRDNGVSSSGGVLRALIADALTKGTPVVCLVRVEEGEYAARQIHAVGDLARVPGSIYHSVSFVDAIAAIRSADSPAMLVATPCQLEGVAKFMTAVEPDLAEKIALRVGLVCGWMYSHHSLEAFRTYKRLDGGVRDATYRGEDEAGRLKLDVGGVVHSFDRRQFASKAERLDYQASFSRYTNRLRCRVCEDHVNVLADVAVGDAWLERKAGEKLSIVVVRTERGERVIDDLRSAGAVTLEAAAATDLRESQSNDLVDGFSASALNQFLRGRGRWAPTFQWDAGGAPSVPTRSFRFELQMRRLVRSGRYRSFRRLYRARGIAKAARQRIQQSVRTRTS